ncbi:xylulokinase [Thalassospira povalilytica]|uniref:Xylulose kinase n=1 Tax=Thalassospira povalilytica TaxID=732237 RepID=A0A8I1M5N9_9PROT|nr:xylulokinase [Thalassospira povalilytica]MBN8195740.1 xylulokinase [Thalassospira povalilytica]
MYLGIDVGTSAVKALLIDEHSATVAETDIPLSVSNPHPFWSEQNPDDWWDATLRAIDALYHQNSGAVAATLAIGLSGQMHGATLLDENDKPLRPAILWNDGRAKAECDKLDAMLPDLGTTAGVATMPGMTAPKMLWLQKHEPDIFAKVRTILLPKDYIRFCLSGDKVTEMSDAAGTLWLDEESRSWNRAAIDACGLSMDQIPELVEGSDITGTLRAELVKRWGMKGDVIIAGGGGDAATGGIGVGAVSHGDGFISLGTSSQIFVASDKYRPKPEELLHSFTHAIPAHWFQMAVLLNGASCLQWAAKLLGKSDIGGLLKRVEAQHHKPADIVFLPYLNGERTPHNNPYARGVFFGLGSDTSREAMVQSVLEGVAFALSDAQSRLHAAGTRCALPGVIGGGARSRYWIQLISDIMGTPLARYEGAAKGPAFGAARLARLALTQEAVEDVCLKPVIEEIIEPDTSRHASYQPRFAKFRRLYNALADEFTPD